MGTRYHIEITCPKCGAKDWAYYAPTCGIDDWVCPGCRTRVDLAEYTGISYEDASNAEAIKQIIAKFEADKIMEE